VTAGRGVSGTVVVSAASSLKETFTQLARQFEQAHPGTRVTLNFGGSDALAAQITAGAGVDVFAAASTKTMEVVTAAKDAVGSPTNFAKNKLEIAVPPSNPGQITTLADTTKSGVKLVLCVATVPCGAAATKAYAAAQLTPKPVSLEQDVKSVLTKVELKEADAGIVYQTDVQAAGGKVTGVPFAQADEALATYPIAVVTTGNNATGGAAFVAYVLSADGESVLDSAGFLAP
jgi:molybdate transport system substrate-binding protein